MHAFPVRLVRSRIPRLAAVALLALAWSSPTFCDEIHQAAQKGDVGKVEALLKGNPHLVSRRDSYGMTPLHRAANQGHGDVVRLLLANKAEINGEDNTGSTPLYDAASRGRRNMAELLLVNGAAVNATGWARRTPLHVAEDNKHNDLVALLRRHGGHE